MDGDRDADPRVAAGELLEHEDVADEVRARAAVFLGDTDTEQPQLGERAEQFTREAVSPVPVGGVGRDPVAREVSRERLGLSLLGGELEVHQLYW
jgi:hypothetical protein